jgi:DNA-binding MarR family transcriptional regulator
MVAPGLVRPEVVGDAVQQPRTKLRTLLEFLHFRFAQASDPRTQKNAAPDPSKMFPALPLDTRDRILEFVKTNPGAHLRRICRETGVRMGATQYHLGVLEKEHKVVSTRSGLFRRFFPSLTFDEGDQLILSALHSRTERDILVYLLQHPGASQLQLASFMRVSAPSVNWHMKRLSGSGLVTRSRSGRYVSYRLTMQPKVIARLLRVYQPSIWESLADNLESIWREI